MLPCTNLSSLLGYQPGQATAHREGGTGVRVSCNPRAGGSRADPGDTGAADSIQAQANFKPTPSELKLRHLRGGVATCAHY